MREVSPRHLVRAVVLHADQGRLLLLLDNQRAHRVAQVLSLQALVQLLVLRALSGPLWTERALSNAINAFLEVLPPQQVKAYASHAQQECTRSALVLVLARLVLVERFLLQPEPSAALSARLEPFSPEQEQRNAIRAQVGSTWML